MAGERRNGGKGVVDRRKGVIKEFGFIHVESG